MKKKYTLVLLSVLTVAFFMSVTPLYASAVTSSDQIRGKPSHPGTKAPKVSILTPTAGETVSGIVSITVSATDKKNTLIADIYINDQFVIHANSYAWDTTGLADGSYEIQATAIGSTGLTGSDLITVNIGSGNPNPGVEHWALIVGISDYKAINDLSYCDEDATDWYNYFTALGYEHITVLGDSKSRNYPQYDGIASEYNVKAALQTIISSADADDEIAFVSSGHGSGDGSGSSLLCMWDCYSGENGEDGSLYDTELANILKNAQSDRVFVFLDHCYAGGFGNDLMSMPNHSTIYLTTTCTEDGYGYDDRSHRNGAWTYWFLQYTLEDHFGTNPGTAMESAFTYASGVYPYGGGDAPQEYDGYAGSFLLW
ncbi:MAG: caspase family protein [Promethearchaeota archaeon]